MTKSQNIWRRRLLSMKCYLFLLTSSMFIITLLHCTWLPLTTLFFKWIENDIDWPKNVILIDNQQQHIRNGEKLTGRIFCWIMTSHISHRTRLPAINDTWPKRCDHYLYYTDQMMNSTYPHANVFTSIPNGMPYLWSKTRRALKFTYDHYSNDYDWFVKSDDDTYMIIDNLRRLLNDLQPHQPHYLGYRLRPYLDNGYNAGGAGYVLSKAALQMFVEKLYTNRTICDWKAEYEDVQLAKCLAQVGVYPQDTRDRFKRERFQTFRFGQLFDAKIKDDGDPVKWVFYPIKKVSSILLIELLK